MKRTKLIFSVGLLCLGTGCDATPLSDGGSEIPPVIQEAFDRSCSLSGCHESTTLAGGFSLQAGASSAILGGSTPNSSLPLVQVGDLYGSYLALKMLPASALPPGTPTVAGEQMPLDVSRPNEVALILAWIAGADVSDASLDAPLLCFAPNPLPGMASFEVDVFPILEASCSAATCHGAMTDTNLLIAEDPSVALTALTSGINPDSMLPFITPGMPEQSFLWHKLSGTQTTVGGRGIRMPIGSQMCANDKDVIYKWILQGANP